MFINEKEWKEYSPMLQMMGALDNSFLVPLSVLWYDPRPHPHEKFAPTMRNGGEGGGEGSNHGPMVAKLSPVSGNIVNKGGGGMGQHGTLETGAGCQFHQVFWGAATVIIWRRKARRLFWIS